MLKQLFKISAFAFFLALTFPLQAQQEQWCGTDYNLQQLIEQGEVTQQQVDQAMQSIDGPMAPQMQGQRAIKIIPVVFHIVHDNGEGNISYEQVLSAIDMLNEDFRRTNSDTNQTRAVFKPFAADSEIEFRLAGIDPNGDCTNGIVRINNPAKSNSADNGVKSLSYWPANKYFNIWVVNSIGGGGGGGTILGYAQFPGGGSWSTYGIVIRHDRVGRTGTAMFGDRTLTHEVGHCLGLYHTFQDGCGSSCQSSGDRVCDTPPTANSTFGCNNNQNTCSNDMAGNSPYTSNVPDQIENYMSYDDCQNLFTLGQKARMHNALGAFSQLVNLTSASNLAATGVLNPTTGICKADFDVKSNVICPGVPVAFTDQSYFNPTSYSWEFDGGIPTTSTAKNPTVVYYTPGTYRVKLTISDGTNSLTEIKENYITVLPDAPLTPFTEGFEFSGDLEDEHWYGDMFSNGLGWVHSTNAGATGTSSVKADLFANNEGTINLVSPSYNLSNLTNATLSFKYAHAARNGEAIKLKVYVSKDCGQNWSIKYIKANSGLVTTNPVAGPYTPNAAGDWKSETVNLSGNDMSASLRIKFVLEVDDANNFYIDDINISGTLSSIPALQYPKNNMQDRAETEVLNWYAAAPAKEYQVELDTSMLFLSNEYRTGTTTYAGTVSNGPDTKYTFDNLLKGATYYWRVRTINQDGSFNPWSDVWQFTVSTTVGVQDAVSNSYKAVIYPNPSEGNATLELDVEKPGNVSIVMFDITGRRVNNIFSGEMSTGHYQMEIDRKNLTKGVYFIRIDLDGNVNTTKLVFN